MSCAASEPSRSLNPSAVGGRSTGINRELEELKRIINGIELSRTYHGFGDDGGAGHDVILVADGLGDGVELDYLTVLRSLFRYVEVSPKTVTSTEVEES